MIRVTIENVTFNKMSLVKFSGAVLKVLGPSDSYLEPASYIALQKKTPSNTLQKVILGIKA